MSLFTGIRPRKDILPSSIKQGGTDASTREEAVKNLGVPDLDGDNTFTGVNEFEGTTQVRGPFEITLTSSDALNIIDSGGAINVLDFGPSNGATYTFPAGGGTLQTVAGVLTLPYNAQTGTYAIQVSDGVVNCTSGTFTATLPSAVGIAGQWFVVKNSGAGVVTVACTGGQTIDGAATVVLAAAGVARVVSDGANWLAI